MPKADTARELRSKDGRAGSNGRLGESGVPETGKNQAAKPASEPDVISGQRKPRNGDGVPPLKKQNRLDPLAEELRQEAARAQELRLIIKAKRGDREAYGVLYEQHAPLVYRFLVTNTNNVQEAEDLTEEVFIRVWRALAGYEPSEFPFSAFVFRVARNLLIDTYRSQRRIEPPMSIDEHNLDETLADASQALTGKMEFEELYAALQRLREDYREILVLRFIDDLSIDEVSQVMNRSPGAVRVLQHRALAALRKILR
jgi:RNA polymerase sigma-70 factor, ECF subfamily